MDSQDCCVWYHDAERFFAGASSPLAMPLFHSVCGNKESDVMSCFDSLEQNRKRLLGDAFHPESITDPSSHNALRRRTDPHKMTCCTVL